MNFPEQAIAVRGISVPSGVAEQPLSSEETYAGAKNRLMALKQQGAADFYVAIEAGLDGEMTFAWMLIEHQGKLGKARSASLMLPKAALQALEQGQELGDVMDELGSRKEIEYAYRIMDEGTSADRQLATYKSTGSLQAATPE